MTFWRVPPSLHSIFVELDATWPNRSHVLDGTIGDSRHCPGTSDHCPDANGWIHAIDIEKNGINPDFVVGKLSNQDQVVRYINWNHYQYHVRNDFRPVPLTEVDQHTNHIHVSIEHTDFARQFAGPWGIFAPLPIETYLPPDLPNASDANWDHSTLILDLAGDFQVTGDILAGFSTAIAALRS